MQVLCALVILGRMRRGNVGRPLYLSYSHFDARYERYDRLTVVGLGLLGGCEHSFGLPVGLISQPQRSRRSVVLGTPFRPLGLEFNLRPHLPDSRTDNSRHRHIRRVEQRPARYTYRDSRRCGRQPYARRCEACPETPGFSCFCGLGQEFNSRRSSNRQSTCHT
jgi:hypothetical protein